MGDAGKLVSVMAGTVDVDVDVDVDVAVAGSVLCGNMRFHVSTTAGLIAPYHCAL